MRIVTWQDGIIQIYVWLIVAILLVVAATVFAIIKNRLPLYSNDKSAEINGFYPMLNLMKFWHLVVFFIAIGIVIGLAYTGSNPFIYFQF
jgi:alginate O-acetyltransferase complex protein AlgI